MKLIDVLDARSIKFPLTGTTKTEVIQELLGLLTENGMIKHEQEVLQAVLEREQIHTTGVGNSVAIPHCKTNDAPEFAVSLGIHPAGVDFQSHDQLPAKIIFLLVGPEKQPGTHIRLLSRISRIISKDEVREQIYACHSADEVYQIIAAEEAQFLESGL